MTDIEIREQALEPVRAALLARAQADASTMRTSAEDEGRRAAAAARDQADAILAQARALGEADAAALLATSSAAHALDKITVGKSVATSEIFATLEVGEEAGIWKQEGLELKILAFRGDAQMQQALAKVGVSVVLESTDAAGWAQRVSNWDYEITTNFLYQYGDPALGVARTYISSNIRKGVLFTNTMGYSNPKVDELFAKASQEIDPAKRQEQYSEVQRILSDDLPVVWLLEMEFPTFLDKRVKNANTTAIGVNDTYESVWLAK